MGSLLQDLRFAVRRLVWDRRFTFAAVAALALGIGATSAVFTLVNAVLLRSLPFDEPGRIMWLNTRDAQGREFGVSEPDFEDWRRTSRTFSGIALVQMGPVNFSGDERTSDQYDGAYISANGFSLIGTQPAIGLRHHRHRIVSIGLTLGLAGAVGTGRLLQGMLVGTGPADV